MESVKDAGNDLDMEVLLRVTLLCIVSNNSHTKVGKIWNITKYFLVYFLYYSVWGIERNGFFNGRGKWVKGFENQRV